MKYGPHVLCSRHTIWYVEVALLKPTWNSILFVTQRQLFWNIVLLNVQKSRRLINVTTHWEMLHIQNTLVPVGRLANTRTLQYCQFCNFSVICSNKSTKTSIKISGKFLNPVNILRKLLAQSDLWPLISECFTNCWRYVCKISGNCLVLICGCLVVLKLLAKGS